MLQTKYFAKPCMGHLKNIYILLDFVLYVSTFCLYTFPDLCSFKQTSATKKKKSICWMSKRIHFKQAFCSGALAPQCITRGENLISSMVQIQCMLSWYIISSCLADASNEIVCQKCMGHLKNIFAGFRTTYCHSRLILKPFLKSVLYITIDIVWPYL